ncbi:NUDIX hydrolase [Brevundimonas basaltis]|uniref:GDP-mannose pyrophosphatase n=1 Tax=Brevundimonas basaltis TaxID=472166 RepID=A0A7W8HXE8_9CAUL|nr:NUDIX hydrolase [Brevundimonas basaltis]MBB5290732.1 8-oxo-dGTP pyrophosphatase MutT (NUDIX family) [Brevundimonas basaltis]
MTDSRDDFDADRPTPGWDDPADRPPPWRSEGETTLFASPWMRLTRHPAVAPTGLEADYVVMRPRNLSVGVLPVHADGTVTLVGQQRFALMNWSWEMPEGGAPFDEDPIEGARRELAEEAGLRAAHWREALKVEMSNSITDERALAWIAWDLSPAPSEPDPTEVLRVARVPFGDLLREIGRGAVRDMFTVATTLRAYHMAREGDLPPELAKAMLASV